MFACLFLLVRSLLINKNKAKEKKNNQQTYKYSFIYLFIYLKFKNIEKIKKRGNKIAVKISYQKCQSFKITETVDTFYELKKNKSFKNLYKKVFLV